MRRLTTLLIILAVSSLLAALLTPPDPFSMCLLWIGMLCIAIPSYIAGLKEGRVQAEKKQGEKKVE